jgi:LmbE family N-acetylglucosaminyl deacetylase
MIGVRGSCIHGNRQPRALDSRHLSDVAIVAAHPDDESIGLGGQLSRMRDATIVHVTDGAPRERMWWGAPELPSREDYARVRRAELITALALAGIGETHLRSLGVPDQEASLDLARLTIRMVDALSELRCRIVLTHSYEGGHPDHDATAFAVHAACRILQRRGRTAPSISEFTSYHARPDGGMAIGEFLPATGLDEAKITLTPTQRARKQRMLSSFATQRETLAQFHVEVEWVRAAPAYDFTAAPHRGRLHYERFAWGCTGEEWRAEARRALRALEIDAETAC